MPVFPGLSFPNGLYKFDTETELWIASQSQGAPLQCGQSIQVVSWNLTMSLPAARVRAEAVLTHLQTVFGHSPSCFVVMLQEVCSESLRAILDSPWVQRNFIVSNDTPPRTPAFQARPARIPPESRMLWAGGYYFTTMMVSKDLDIDQCFRYPLATSTGRDLLFCDIPIYTNRPDQQHKMCFRLCTMQLESQSRNVQLRADQLVTLSDMLKMDPDGKTLLIGGLAGGDTNHIAGSEYSIQADRRIDLMDAWEDHPVGIPSNPPPEYQTHGRLKGDTWGHQMLYPFHKKRVDKFFYSGQVEAFPPSTAQDYTRMLGRLGIGLTVEANVWARDSSRHTFYRGQDTVTPYEEYFDLNPDPDENSAVYKRASLYASEHFGIAIGIRVRELPL